MVYTTASCVCIITSSLAISICISPIWIWLHMGPSWLLIEVIISSKLYIVSIHRWQRFPKVLCYSLGCTKYNCKWAENYCRRTADQCRKCASWIAILPRWAENKLIIVLVDEEKQLFSVSWQGMVEVIARNKGTRQLRFAMEVSSSQRKLRRHI